MNLIAHRHLRVLAGATLLATACSSKPDLTKVDLNGLTGLAQQVETPRLLSNISDLAAARQGDTPVDCRFWPLPPDAPPRWCHISRAKARDLMESRFRELGLNVRRQEETSEIYHTVNIIADIPGSTHPEEVVLIGSHYDAFWAGADDNTSGLSALLELARVLSQRRFDRTLRFVAFDFEEIGDVGSHRYVAAQDPKEKLILALIFDCIGYYSTTPGSQASLPGLPSPDRGDFVAIISDDVSASRASEVYALGNALGGAKAIPLIVPADGSTPTGEPLLRSDHASFWLSGFPALFMTDTALYRNPNYHQDSDTLETLDPARYGKTVQLAIESVGYWAGGPR